MTKSLMEIDGFAELQAKIKALATDRQKRTETLKILRKVAQATVKVARQKAPKSKRKHVISGSRTKKTIDPGNLQKSIGVITGRKGNAKENPTVYVGPRAKGKYDGFYGNFVEYGHNVYRKGYKRGRKGTERDVRRNNKAAVRRTKPQPFMAKTYDQTKGQVTPQAAEAVAKVIQKRIDALSR